MSTFVPSSLSLFRFDRILLLHTKYIIHVCCNIECRIMFLLKPHFPILVKKREILMRIMHHNAKINGHEFRKKCLSILYEVLWFCLAWLFAVPALCSFFFLYHVRLSCTTKICSILNGTRKTLVR